MLFAIDEAVLARSSRPLRSDKTVPGMRTSVRIVEEGETEAAELRPRRERHEERAIMRKEPVEGRQSGKRLVSHQGEPRRMLPGCIW